MSWTFLLFPLQLKKKSAAPILPKNRQKFWNLKQVSDARFFHFLPRQRKEGYWQRLFISCKQLPRWHPSHPAWSWVYILSAAQRLSESRALIMLDSHQALDIQATHSCPIPASDFLAEFRQILPYLGLTFLISLEPGSSKVPAWSPAPKAFQPKEPSTHFLLSL